MNGRARYDRRPCRGLGGARGPSDGFTLVELLLATAIFAVAAVALYTAFAAGMRIRSESRARLEQVRTLRDLEASLRDDLSNLCAAHPNLSVEEGRILLLRPGRPGAGAPGFDGVLNLVHYHWVERPGGQRTFVRSSRTLPTDLLGEASEVLRLAATSGDAEADSAPTREPQTSWHSEEASKADGLEFPGLETFAALAVTLSDGELVESAPGVQDSTLGLVRVTVATGVFEDDPGGAPLPDLLRDFRPSGLVARAESAGRRSDFPDDGSGRGAARFWCTFWLSTAAVR